MPDRSPLPLDTALAENSPLRQAMIFGFVGVLATATHFAVALAVHAAFRLPPLAASLVGYCAAVSVSYFGNARLTFARRAADGAQFARFAVVSLTGLAISQSLTYLGSHVMKAPFVVAMIPVVTVVPVFSFVASRLWAFQARN